MGVLYVPATHACGGTAGLAHWWPAGHGSHVPPLSPRKLNVPLGHGMGMVVLKGHVLPAGHVVHAVCMPVEYVPAAHEITKSSYVLGHAMPGGQGVHVVCDPGE